MTRHKSVLLREVLEFLKVGTDKNFIDATLGTGGHSESILKKTAPKGIVVGFERDLITCKVARDRLSSFGERFRLIEHNFSGIAKAQKEVRQGFDGILWDFGISSVQLDDPLRGFSFLREGPIDMRMDKREDLTAETIVNNYPEKDLVEIFSKLGEERFSKRMARSIVRERAKRKITSTTVLADILAGSVPAKFRRGKIHPATKAFMALRIFTNRELENIEKSLEDSLGVVKKGGRLTAISFHSLEDRIVKRFFREKSRRCTCPRDLPKCICGGKATLKIITSKPVLPSADEIKENPRARSAKLRVAEVIQESVLYG